MPNLKVSDPQQFGWLKLTFVKHCEEEEEEEEKEEKCEENGAIFRNTYLSSNLVCRVAYMEGIKYVNLIEINPVVIEI